MLGLQAGELCLRLSSPLAQLLSLFFWSTALPEWCIPSKSPQTFPSDALIPWIPEKNQHPCCISSISFFPHVLPSLQGLTCVKIGYYHWCCLFFIAILAVEHRLSCVIDRYNDSELHPNFLFLTLTIWWVVKRSTYKGSWIETIEDSCQGNTLFTPGR